MSEEVEKVEAAAVEQAAPVETVQNNEAPVAVESPKDFLQYVPEKYKERFKEPTEVFSFLEDLETKASQTPPQEEYSDLIKRAIELEKSGTQINLDLLKELSVDYTKFSVTEKSDALYLVKESMKKAYPDATEREIERKISKKYSALYNEDEDSDDYADALFDLKQDAKAAQGKLTEYQKSISLPKEGARREAPKVDIEAVRRVVNEQAKQLSKIEFESDGIKVEYSIEPATLAKVQEMAINPDKMFSRWLTEGQLDYGKMMKDFAILEDMTNINKVVMGQAKAIAKAEQLKSDSNIQVGSGTQPAGTSEPSREKGVIVNGVFVSDFERAKIQENLKKYLNQ